MWHPTAGNREDGHDRDLGARGGRERLRDAVAFEAEVEGAERGDTEGETALLDGDEYASSDTRVMLRNVGEHEAKQRPEHERLTHPRDG